MAIPSFVYIFFKTPHLWQHSFENIATMKHSKQHFYVTTSWDLIKNSDSLVSSKDLKEKQTL